MNIVDVAKIIGIIVFIGIIVVEIFTLNFNVMLTQGIHQISDLSSSLKNLYFKFFYYKGDLILCANNQNNFSITIYNLTGKYTYIKYPETILPHTIKNITIIVTNWNQFIKSYENGSYNLTTKLSFLGLNVTSYSVI